jgi:mono/diheme cytochrome c family protein
MPTKEPLLRKKISLGAKIGLVALAGIVILCGIVVYLAWWLPQVGRPADVHVDAGARRLARGKYLVENVAACADCHSPVDESKLWYHPLPGKEGAGGRIFPGPGQIYSANITPAHLGNWTDGEILRAFTAGVSKDGHALFPIMPYLNYGTMDRDDALAIVAYLRTLKPIPSNVPKTHIAFIPSLFINLTPQPAKFSPRPPETDVVKYGQYLATVASCVDCHTPRNARGQQLPGMNFAGGMEFPLSTGGILRSANITPDPQTGIGNWTRDQFVRRFKALAEPDAQQTPAGKNQFHSVMPWINFSGMSASDLSAIYAYLKTVNPVSHKVDRFTPGQPIGR